MQWNQSEAYLKPLMIWSTKRKRRYLTIIIQNWRKVELACWPNLRSINLALCRMIRYSSRITILTINNKEIANDSCMNSRARHRALHRLAIIKVNLRLINKKTPRIFIQLMRIIKRVFWNCRRSLRLCLTPISVKGHHRVAQLILCNFHNLFQWAIWEQLLEVIQQHWILHIKNKAIMLNSIYKIKSKLILIIVESSLMI